MNYRYFLRLIRMIVVLLLQIVFLNNIHILGYVTPLFFGYMILPFNRGAGRIELLIWGFMTGLLFDIFSNTAGMGASSCTLLSMMQPTLLKLFAPRDAVEDFTPSFNVMGFWGYTAYAFLGMLVTNATFYILDAFTISNWQLTLAAIGIGTVTATLLCIIAELLTKEKK